MRNVKQKFMGGFGALLALLLLIAPASAGSVSDNVGATSTIPETMSFNVVPNALTYNLNQYDVFKDPNEGAMRMTVGGNIAGASIYGKITTSSGIVFRNPFEGTPFTDTDSQVSGNVPSGSYVDIMVQAKALAGKAPGVYNDVLVFTAVSN